ncbi:hypothetical protein LBMAG53_11320 [Planctomycetota bacterium]|nr:hypothetical protein LBMAG53_11320 [Planctomycetota bacterium]
MARMPLDNDDEGDDEMPQFISLIDILVVLIIFFLVTSAFKAPVRTWDIQLPADTYALSARPKKEQLVITLVPGPDPKRAETLIHLGTSWAGSREKATLTEVRTILADAAARPGKPTVRLDVDRKVQMESVAEILDLLRINELRDVSFRAKDRK